MTDQELVHAAIAAAAETSGLAMRLRPGLHVEIGGHRLRVIVKPTIDRPAAIAAISEQLDDERDRSLVVTRHLGSAVLDVCRALGVNAADSVGNMHLRVGETFVLVGGRPRPKAPTTNRLGWTAAAVRVGLVALSAPERLSTNQRALAAASGIALGSVGSTLEWFRGRGYLIDRNSKLIVRRSDELLTEWSVAYATRLRPRLDAQRFALSEPDTSWWRHADIEPAVWSGEVGAALLERDLRPIGAQIYVDTAARGSTLRTLVRAHRLVADPNGPIEVLTRFWHFADEYHPQIAPLPVLYADLVELADPRTNEAAAKIRERLRAA